MIKCLIEHCVSLGADDTVVFHFGTEKEAAAMKKPNVKDAPEQGAYLSHRDEPEAYRRAEKVEEVFMQQQNHLGTHPARPPRITI